jgi:flagellin
MPLNLISNFAAHVAQRNLSMSDSAATSSLAKLSSGSRVVSAKDDAASLAVGSRLNAEVIGLKQASVNAGQAISMMQIADGAMAKVNDILVRMKSLAVQAGSGQLSGTERSMLDTEYQALRSEVDRIANDTDFAGTLLVDGSVGVTTSSATAFAADQGVQDITFVGNHSTAANATVSYNSTTGFSVDVVDGAATNTFTGTIGSGTNDGTNMTTGTVVTLTNTNTTNKIDIALNTAFVVNTAHATGTLGLSGATTASFNFKVGTGVSATADEITVSVNSVDTAALGISTTAVTTESGADLASVALSNAIDNLQTYRATIGANQNRLEFAAANIATATENTEAARSQLLDLDIASEMSNFVSKQILIQAGVAMLSQANQLPSNLLRLFQ